MFSRNCLVLMDCQMPVMDGYQASKTIRHIEEKNGLRNHLPIIALTANALEGDREKCLLAGIDDYISKPFEQETIFKILEQWSFRKLRKLQMSGEDLSLKETESEMVRAEQLQGDGLAKNIETNSVVIDQGVLRTLRNLQMEGQPDILNRIVTAYLKSSEPIIAELQKELEAGEYALVKDGAYNLKSSSANVGAIQLSELTKELEMLNKKNEFKYAKELISAIESEFILVKAELHREIS